MSDDLRRDFPSGCAAVLLTGFMVVIIGGALLLDFLSSRKKPS